MSSRSDQRGGLAAGTCTCSLYDVIYVWCPMPMFCDKFLHTFGMDARFSSLKMPLLCCMNSWAVKH